MLKKFRFFLLDRNEISLYFCIVKELDYGAGYTGRKNKGRDKSEG